MKENSAATKKVSYVEANTIQNLKAKLIPENIPEYLRNIPQWVCWKYKEVDGRMTKIPIDSRKLTYASTSNALTYSSFQEALDCLSKNADTLDGIGIVLTKEDNLIGIDIDKCVNEETGKIEEFAQEIIGMVQSYAEFSPSGKGIRIFCHGQTKLDGSRKGKIEIYTNGRYLTVTGNHLKGTPYAVNQSDNAIEELNCKLFKYKEPIISTIKEVEKKHEPNVQEIIQQIKDSKQYGEEFEDLMQGKIGKYPSQSEADLRLCGIISNFTDEQDKIDGVFRKSELLREKWDSKHGKETYGAMTIGKVIQFKSRADSKPKERAFKDCYEYRKDGIYQKNNDGAKQLCNFTAVIEEIEKIDVNGIVETRYIISGKDEFGKELAKVTTSQEDFKNGNWLDGSWAGDVIISPGNGAYKNIHAAILSHSEALKSVAYSELGWKTIDGIDYYLTNSGGISKDGLNTKIKVELKDGGMKCFSLPEPPSGELEIQAIKSALSFLDMTKGEITAPLFGLIYVSVLDDIMPIDTSAFIFGRSGSKKSELASIVQAHFGKDFRRKTLPANWSSTENAIERQMHNAKDSILIIDEYRQSGIAAVDTELKAKSTRIFMNIGNKASRERSNTEGTLKASNNPRCVVIVTGEEIPIGEAVRARTITIEVLPKDIESEKLTFQQQNSMKGLNAAAMAGYIKYIAEKKECIIREIEEIMQEERSFFSKKLKKKEHDRVPEALALMAIGTKLALTYFMEAGAISEEEYTILMNNCRLNLLIAGNNHIEQIILAVPADVFMEKIKSALQSEAYYLQKVSGNVSINSERIGNAKRLGYIDVDNDCIYLDANESYIAVNTLCKNLNESFSVHQKTLSKQLVNKKYVYHVGNGIGTARLMVDDIRQGGLYKMVNSAMFDEDIVENANDK